MRLTVLGANNFVGRRILQLAARESSVTVLAADYRFANEDVQVPKLTVGHDKGSWNALVQQSDLIISCTMGGPSSIVQTMQSLIAALGRSRAPQVTRLVHISSMTVYGNATGLVAESQDPVGTLSKYAAARLEAERIAAAYPHVVTLRPGCEYGPGCTHWSDRVARWLLARRLGDLGARGDGYCNLTYIDDLASAALRASQAPGVEGSTFNIATDTPLTWNEYFMRFAMALRAVPVRRVTARRLKIETRMLAAPLKIGEMVSAKLGVTSFPLPAIPPSLVALCAQDIRLDVTRAEKMLGMSWTPIADGLASAAASIKH